MTKYFSCLEDNRFYFLSRREQFCRGHHQIQGATICSYCFDIWIFQYLHGDVDSGITANRKKAQTAMRLTYKVVMSAIGSDSPSHDTLQYDQLPSSDNVFYHSSFVSLSIISSFYFPVNFSQACSMVNRIK